MKRYNPSTILLLLLVITSCVTSTKTKIPVLPGTLPVKENFMQNDLEEFYSFKSNKPASSKKEAEALAKKLEKKTLICSTESCTENLTRKESGPKVKPFNKENFNFLQTEVSFLSQQKTLRKVSDDAVKKNIDLITSVKECPRNLSAALLRKIEYKESNREVIQKLFTNLSECDYKKEYEILYLRQALMSRFENNEAESVKAIKTIIDSQDYDDPARVLYWAGVILKDDAHFKNLIALRPYSIHAVRAAELVNLNVWDVINSRADILETREDNALTKNIELLLYYNFDKAAFKLLHSNVKSFKEKSGSLLYLVKLINRHGELNQTVMLVSRISYQYPEYFNMQFISLAYQRPYLEFYKPEAPIEVNLMIALTKQESAFNPKAKSSARAQGLMQLLPSTARMVNRKMAKKIFDPETNISLGTQYFKSVYNKFNNVEKALASYNAGPGNVAKWENNFNTSDNMLFMDLIPFSETRVYVATILRNEYFYNQIYK